MSCTPASLAQKAARAPIVVPVKLANGSNGSNGLVALMLALRAISAMPATTRMAIRSHFGRQ